MGGKVLILIMQIDLYDYFLNAVGILRKWRIWKVRLFQSLLPFFLFGKSKYLLDVAWLYEYNGNAI